ncbi:hypothetical protein R7Z42_14520 [Vibrio sp. 1863]|uniref:hypothetical protein n=1 Tax=Vibrio sp. 1863 TaxID=3074579 RepID=UPI00296531C0|nr:hypothetical protein [Vibrio sp. 1863]MDW2076232.1 hypothetical protein [Vibrio sp. 1863]
MTFTKTLWASTIALSLIGCGGGNSNSNSEETASAISGKVIDGYISGATVFLDLNFNGKLEDGEPNALTDENGNFDLEITETLSECSQYVPTVTHVPVGAIDSDFPDTPIEKAYTMVAPPSFAMSTNQDLLNLTPLTSIVWDSVEKELASTGQSLSCESIVAEQQLREDITTRLEQQEIRVAQRYNVTVDELYSDYVESGNSALHRLAQDLVPALQASYSDTLVLEASYPNANYLFVEYFLGMLNETTDDYDSQWYRREYVATTPGNYTDVTNLVSSDLSTIGDVFEHVSQRTFDNGIYEYKETIRYAGTDNWTPTNLEYSCSIGENYRDLTSLGQYGIRNGAYNNTVSNFDDCADLDRVANNVTQAITTRTFHNIMEEVYRTESSHWWNTTLAPEIPEVIGMGDQIDTLEAGWLYHRTNRVQTNFHDSSDYGADGFTRVMNEYEFEDEGIYYKGWQKVHMRDQDDNYTVTYFFDDGTYKKLCGTYPSLESGMTDCTN